MDYIQPTGLLGSTFV